MNKLKILAFALLAIVSCRKSDEGEVTPPAPTTLPEKTSDAFFKDGFTGSLGEELIPGRSLKNIRTGDMIPYSITISDTKEEEGLVYVLTPITDDAKAHQTRLVDYELYIDLGEGLKRVEGTEVTFTKIGKYDFFIKPLVPGTFQLPFVFQKRTEGNKVLEHKRMANIVFNAVTITALSKAWQDGWVWEGWLPPEQFSDNRRNYRFKVDDGSNETDIYLQPQNANQFFRIAYKGHNAGGALVVGQEYEFHPTERRIKANPELKPDTVTITVVQQRAGEEEVLIEYANVPIIDEK